MPTSGLVGITVSPAARDALQRITYAATGAASRRVTLSAALLALVALADRHPDELVEIVTTDTNVSKGS